jgi:8-oxo-dGTP diphosphatase
MGIFGLDVTIIVDVANVMGSRPDGWWRDRAGAAVRLHDQIAELAASGGAILPGDDQPPGERPGPGAHARPGERPGPAEPGEPAGAEENAPAFVLVLEGAARAAIPRLPSAISRLPSARPGTDGLLHLQPGEVRVVEARGSGDDAIVAVVHELSGRRVVVTADRELRARCAAAGAEILGPGWLLGLLREPRSPQAFRD